jgi:hypothetical protein
VTGANVAPAGLHARPGTRRMPEQTPRPASAYRALARARIIQHQVIVLDEVPWAALSPRNRSTVRPSARCSKESVAHVRGRPASGARRAGESKVPIASDRLVGDGRPHPLKLLTDARTRSNY